MSSHRIICVDLVPFEFGQMRLSTGRTFPGISDISVDDKIPQYERIHLSRCKTSIGFLSRTNNRLSANIETGIDEHGTISEPIRFAQKSVKPSTPTFVGRMNPSTVVDKRHCWRT